MTDSPETVIATLTPRGTRRWMGIGVHALLGGVLIVLGLELMPTGPLWGLFVAGLGALALAGAVRMHRATALKLELTETELRDSAGRVLARIDEVRGVEKGAFAFKPSQGFLVVLKTPQPRAWHPGLWWRFGRFVGIGGVTPANEGKAMAELIALRLASREGAG